MRKVIKSESQGLSCHRCHEDIMQDDKIMGIDHIIPKKKLGSITSNLHTITVWHKDCYKSERR